MKKFLLFLTLFLSAVGIAQAAEVQTISSNFTDKDLTVGTGELEWTASPAPGSFESANNARGLQFGAAIGTFTLKSKTSISNFKKIKLILSTNNTGNTINSIKVDKTEILTSSVSLSKSNNTEYTYEYGGDAVLSGVITISITDNNKTVWVKSITVSYEDGGSSTLTDPKITWKKGETVLEEGYEVEATLGGENTLPTLNYPNGVGITYSSSDESVATIAADGTIKIKAAGTTTIKAVSTANETYKQASASYTLKVIDPNEKSVTDIVNSACFSNKPVGAYTIYNHNSSTGAVYTARVIIENNTFRLNKAAETYFCVSTAPKNYKLSKIVLHKTTGSNAVNIYASTTAYTKQGSNPPGGTLIRTTATANGDYTIDFTADSDPKDNPLKDTNYVAFYVVGPGGVTNFSSIDVTWEPTASEGEITKDPALSFDASVSYATLGEDFVEPTLSTATGVTGVVYSSSNSEIASVNAETGEVTPNKVGTVTITAKKEADEDFDGQEVKYELNVLAAETYASTDDMSKRSDLTNKDKIVGEDIAVGDATIYFDGTGASYKTSYYAGEGIRFYADNSLTITAPEGKYLTKVTFIGITKGEVTSLTPSYGSIDTDNDCWLCNGKAQNSVTISTSAQVRFTGIIIEYSKYKLAHGESTSDSQVTFLENTNSNNNLQLYGAFTPSTSLTVDSYIIRVNGIEAATIEGTADDFTLTGLPYIKDATFTIAPVVDGVELPQEVLDDVKMVNLDDFKYEFITNELIWVNDKDTDATSYQIGAILYFADAFGVNGTNLNYLVDVTADGYQGEFSWADGGFTYSIANVLSVTTLENGLPKVSDVYPAPEIIVNLTPSYRFNYDAKYSSLLPSEAITSAPARAPEQHTQNYTCDPQQLNCKIDVTQEVSGVESVTVDANAPVEFFNLQGVRVDGDLAPGIYIRRQGQSVSKVQIR